MNIETICVLICLHRNIHVRANIDTASVGFSDREANIDTEIVSSKKNKTCTPEKKVFPFQAITSQGRAVDKHTYPVYCTWTSRDLVRTIR